MPVLLVFFAVVVVDVAPVPSAPGVASKDSDREEAIPPFISSSRPYCNSLGPRGPCLSSLFLLMVLLDEAEGSCL